MLITDHYRELNAQLHDTNPLYGVSSSKWAPAVAGLADQIGTRDILDYGWAKGCSKTRWVGRPENTTRPSQEKMRRLNRQT